LEVERWAGVRYRVTVTLVGCSIARSGRNAVYIARWPGMIIGIWRPHVTLIARNSCPRH
jgi:hypothetical protein